MCDILRPEFETFLRSVSYESLPSQSFRVMMREVLLISGLIGSWKRVCEILNFLIIKMT